MSIELQIVIWRGLRGAIAAGFTSAIALQPDWSKPEEAMRIVAIAFVSGALLSLGKFVRDQWGNNNQSKGLINKLPV